MAEYLGCDYANPPSQDPGWFAQQGFSFVCRYLATGTKDRTDLTAEEVTLLARAGIGVVTIWETTGGDEDYTPGGMAFFTAEHGAHEGARALAQAKAIGQPAAAPIYATVDFNAKTDADMAAILAYMQAFAAAIGPYPLGVYGSYAVIDRMQALTPWLWQTYAWSNVQLHHKAVLHQFRNTQTFDYDRAFGNPGWWRVDGQPVQAAPAPAQPPPQKGVTTVPLTRRGDQGLQVSVLQLLLTLAGYRQAVPADGEFGLELEGQVRSFQRDHSLAIDGIVGPATWGALAQVQPPVKGSTKDLNDMATQIQNLTNALGDANNKLAQARSVAGNLVATLG